MKQKVLIIALILFSGIIKSQTTDVLFKTDKKTLDSRLISHVNIYYNDTTIYHRLYFHDQSCKFESIPLGQLEAIFYTRFHDSRVVNLNLRKRKKLTKIDFPDNTIYSRKIKPESLTDRWIRDGGRFQIYISTQAGCMDFWEQKFEFFKSDTIVLCSYWRQNHGVSNIQDTVLTTKSLSGEIFRYINSFETTLINFDYSACGTNYGHTFSKAIIFYDKVYEEFPFCPTTNKDFNVILGILTDNVDRYIQP